MTYQIFKSILEVRRLIALHDSIDLQRRCIKGTIVKINFLTLYDELDFEI